MFVDNVEIYVKAGKGGDGRTSFLHEKYRAKGGPDGGDGGHGGDVIFTVDHNLNTLAHFRGTRKVEAENGQPGGKNKSHGKSAPDVIVKVPVGTMVFDGEHKVADLVEDGASTIIAHGGKGGFGNAHFVSSTRQTPRAAELGEAGEAFTLRLELKLVADVGLIGLPNAGKSTLLSVISASKPKIADYAFTTLTPNLGVAKVDNDGLVVADIPGLIEGASQGKGLGDEFLRHIERTAVLLHLVDAHNDDAVASYKTIQAELKSHGHGLTEKPQIVVLTKVEGMPAADVRKLVSALKKASKQEVFAISSAAHQGLQELLRAAMKTVQAARKAEAENEELFVYDLGNVKLPSDSFSFERTKTAWVVKGDKIERFARRTDFASEPSVDRLRDIMRKIGLVKKLEQAGLEAGDKIEIAAKELIW